MHSRDTDGHLLFQLYRMIMLREPQHYTEVRIFIHRLHRFYLINLRNLWINSLKGPVPLLRSRSLLFFCSRFTSVKTLSGCDCSAFICTAVQSTIGDSFSNADAWRSSQD